MSVIYKLIEGTFLERWCITVIDWLNRILTRRDTEGE